MEALKKKLIEHLLQTPAALALVVFSYLSGHLWVYVIFAHLKKGAKANKLLSSHVGRVALGIGWFAVVLLPLHRLSVGNFSFKYPDVLQLTAPLIVYGLITQMLVFAILTGIGKSR